MTLFPFHMRWHWYSLRIIVTPPQITTTTNTMTTMKEKTNNFIKFGKYNVKMSLFLITSFYLLSSAINFQVVECIQPVYNIEGEKMMPANTIDIIYYCFPIFFSFISIFSLLFVCLVVCVFVCFPKKNTGVHRVSWLFIYLVDRPPPAVDQSAVV